MKFTQQQKNFYGNKLVDLLEIYNELEPILGDLEFEKKQIVEMIRSLQKEESIVYV